MQARTVPVGLKRLGVYLLFVKWAPASQSLVLGLLIFIWCVLSFCPLICLCTTCMPCLWRSEEGMGSTGTGVSAGLSCHGVLGTEPCPHCHQEQSWHQGTLPSLPQRAKLAPGRVADGLATCRQLVKPRIASATWEGPALLSHLTAHLGPHSSQLLTAGPLPSLSPLLSGSRTAALTGVTTLSAASPDLRLQTFYHLPPSNPIFSPSPTLPLSPIVPRQSIPPYPETPQC